MQGAKDLDSIVKSVRGASTSTESRFVEIGDRLEQAVETLASLTATFTSLSDELKGNNLVEATGDLSKIAARVTGLAKAIGSELGSFGKLITLTTTIERRVANMSLAVRGAGMLATNAKIVAANIGDTKEDLVSFASDITKTLRLAEASLDQFAAELARVGGDLSGAVARQSNIEEQQEAAVEAIPVRLGQSLDALSGRTRNAASVALAVSEGSQRIGRLIGNVVMALQIGDITRQRIEHVDAALGSIARLNDAQDGLIAIACRIQAAQLVDTADEFDQEIGQILQSLEALAEDARQILNRGNDAFGASDRGGGTFLGEVAEQITDVENLLSGFRSARSAADEVAASVTEATTRLVGHIRTVRSLEDDIRLMGLNTTLKCGRLGVAGRPLAIIAQELRRYANDIGADATEIMIALDEIVALARAVSDRSSDGAAADIGDLSGFMAQALTRLSAAGRNLSEAFATLERDGSSVASALQQTVDRAGAHDEIGRVLREAGNRLGKYAEATDDDVPDSPEAELLFAQFMKSYTMQRERTVLARHAPGFQGGTAAEPQPPATVDDLEDVFF